MQDILKYSILASILYAPGLFLKVPLLVLIAILLSGVLSVVLVEVGLIINLLISPIVFELNWSLSLIVTNVVILVLKCYKHYVISLKS